MSTTGKRSRNERASTRETKLFSAAEAACRRGSLRRAQRLLERVVRLRGQLRTQAKIYLGAIRLFANAEAAYEHDAFVRSYRLFIRAAKRCSPLEARARRYLAQIRVMLRREIRGRRPGGAAFEEPGSDFPGARITPGKKGRTAPKRRKEAKPTKEKKARPKTAEKKGREKAGRPSTIEQTQIVSRGDLDEFLLRQDPYDWKAEPDSKQLPRDSFDWAPGLPGEGGGGTGRGAGGGGGFLPPPPPPPPAPQPSPGPRPELSAGAEDTIVRRTPHMDLSFDRAVQPGDEFSVRVYLDASAPHEGEQSDDVVIRAPRDTPVLVLEVWLACTPHFEIAELRIQPLTLRLNGSPRPGENSTVFSVRVKPALADVDGASLTAYFFYNGRPSGKVTREIAIVAAVKSRPVDSQPTRTAVPARANYSAMELNATAVSPDLTVEITDPERNLQRLRCRVSSPLLRSAANPTDWFLPQRTGDLVAELMREFVEPGVDARQRLLRLKGAGRLLFDTAPEDFKRIFWHLIDSGKPLKTIYIVSEDPYIPWELMIPHRRRPDGSDEQRTPLGVEFTIGRWIPEDYLSPAQRISLKDGFVIAPIYPGPKPKPLAFAPAEMAFVRAQVENAAILPIEPADRDTIDARLAERKASLLHFVCHGAQANQIGLQRIYVAGTPQAGTLPTLSSIEIGQMDGFKATCQGKPLVFLNACEVGRATAALAGVGGFAKAFIDLQASGVIAPLWSVKDELAHDVAKTFYTRLKEEPHRPFAEIVQTIRAKAYETGEDTYAAYCFYGDPLARLVNSRLDA